MASGINIVPVTCRIPVYVPVVAQVSRNEDPPLQIVVSDGLDEGILLNGEVSVDFCGVHDATGRVRLVGLGEIDRCSRENGDVGNVVRARERGGAGKNEGRKRSPEGRVEIPSRREDGTSRSGDFPASGKGADFDPGISDDFAVAQVHSPEPEVPRERYAVRVEIEPGTEGFAGSDREGFNAGGLEPDFPARPIPVLGN